MDIKNCVRVLLTLSVNGDMKRIFSSFHSKYEAAVAVPELFMTISSALRDDVIHFPLSLCMTLRNINLQPFNRLYKYLLPNLPLTEIDKYCIIGNDIFHSRTTYKGKYLENSSSTSKRHFSNN